jgi:hypothetical protein
LSQYLVQITYSSEEQLDAPTDGIQLDDEIMAIPVPLHLQTQGDVSGYQYVEGEMLSISSYTIGDQLTCIKSLINRKAYSLTDKQCKLIHQKFNNMSENRLKSLFLQEKELLKGDRIFRDKDQFPEPVPRLPIKETLREPFTPKQEIMTERPR